MIPTSAGAHPEGIAAAPNGVMWFAQEAVGNIARIDDSGTITEAKTVKGSGPFFITVDADGNPWYTMKAANKVANFQLR
jgi:streptogramin lyase